MSKQMELDDGTIISLYCGPIRADGEERRRIAIHTKGGAGVVADYPLVPSDRLSAAREGVVKALEEVRSLAQSGNYVFSSGLLRLVEPPLKELEEAQK